jgi:hypothetical protein
MRRWPCIRIPIRSYCYHCFATLLRILLLLLVVVVVVVVVLYLETVSNINFDLYNFNVSRCCIGVFIINFQNIRPAHITICHDSKMHIFNSSGSLVNTVKL